MLYPTELRARRKSARGVRRAARTLRIKGNSVDFMYSPTDGCLPMLEPGGESGIRTHGRLPYTRFPSVRLRPLGHLSRNRSSPAKASHALCGLPAVGYRELGSSDTRDQRLIGDRPGDPEICIPVASPAMAVRVQLPEFVDISEFPAHEPTACCVRSKSRRRHHEGEREAPGYPFSVKKSARGTFFSS